MNNEQTVDSLKLPAGNKSVDVADLTDEDIKQLVICHATIIRNRASTREQLQAVMDTWSAWPKELRDRFYKMVQDEAYHHGNGQPTFWSRPADNNIRWGL